jgi:hypothetical protein
MLLLSSTLLFTHPTSTTLFPILSKLTVSVLSFEDLTDNSITLELCANISRKEHLKLIFIHKLVQPRCFPKHFDSNVLVHYYSNINSWMIGDIFTDWVIDENERMVVMQRKILILLDNAASHKVESVEKSKISEFDTVILSNITLFPFLQMRPLLFSIWIKVSSLL